MLLSAFHLGTQQRRVIEHGETAVLLQRRRTARGGDVRGDGGVELLGARVDAIRCAEDRELFKKAVAEVGLECPRAHTARTIEEAGWNSTVAREVDPDAVRRLREQGDRLRNAHDNLNLAEGNVQQASRDAKKILRSLIIDRCILLLLLMIGVTIMLIFVVPAVRGNNKK